MTSVTKRPQTIRQPSQAVANLSDNEAAERQEWRRLQDLDKEHWEGEIRLNQLEGIIRRAQLDGYQVKGLRTFGGTHPDQRTKRPESS